MNLGKTLPKGTPAQKQYKVRDTRQTVKFKISWKWKQMYKIENGICIGYVIRIATQDEVYEFIRKYGESNNVHTVIEYI